MYPNVSASENPFTIYDSLFFYLPFTIHYSPFAVLACDYRCTSMVAKPKTERREHFETSSGIELPVDFNPSNTEPVEYDRDLG